MPTDKTTGPMNARARLALELARDSFAQGDAKTALSRFIEAVEQAPGWARHLNVDPMLELMMTAFRRWFALAPDLTQLPEMAPCLAALREQGRVNEFVFYESAEDKAAVDDPRVRPMYRADVPYAPPRAFERLGAIEDPVSRRVAEQYERNPYPRWLPSGPPPWGDYRDNLNRMRERHGLPPLREGAHILVPGCGTGRHAMNAAAGFGRDVQVLAVDLSRTSLSYAAARCEEMGVTNIRFLQADILSLGALDRRFDLISCAGVLHHMRDPMAGWRVLTDLLQPGGMMSIGLYSARARRPITGFLSLHPPDQTLPIEDRIRDFRHRVIRAHLHEWKDTGIGAHDFFSMSGCRDLFFHEHESRTSVPEIARNLETLGLDFLEFVAPPGYRAGAHPALTDLAAWEPFEERHPATFAGMYQFWCAKR